MGKRGPKPKVTDVGCPNESCTDHNVIGKDNVVDNGGYQLDGKRIRRYLCRTCGRAFCDRTNTVYGYVAKIWLLYRIIENIL
jgi:transposase-like protein